MFTWMHWIEPEENSWTSGFGKGDKGPHREIRLTKDVSSESGERKTGGVVWKLQSLEKEKEEKQLCDRQFPSRHTIVSGKWFYTPTEAKKRERKKQYIQLSRECNSQSIVGCDSTETSDKGNDRLTLNFLSIGQDCKPSHGGLNLSWRPCPKGYFIQNSFQILNCPSSSRKSNQNLHLVLLQGSVNWWAWCCEEFPSPLFNKYKGRGVDVCLSNRMIQWYS